MFTVSRDFTFCYGHRLLNHAGRCAHPHGHNARVRVRFGAAGLNEQGMVIDFADLKRTVGRWIEENLDHRMILQHDDPLAEVLRKMDEPTCLLPGPPTAENLARLIHETCDRFGFSVESVVFWETENCSAEYRKSIT